jgi:hypothetical protein
VRGAGGERGSAHAVEWTALAEDPAVRDRDAGRIRHSAPLKVTRRMCFWFTARSGASLFSMLSQHP